LSSGEFTPGRSWGGWPIAQRIADALPRNRVLVTGTIRDTSTVIVGGSPSYHCVLDDGTGVLGLLFLGRRSVPGLVVGTRCTVEGTARMAADRLVVWNPLYRLEPTHEHCRLST